MHSPRNRSHPPRVERHYKGTTTAPRAAWRCRAGLGREAWECAARSLASVHGATRCSLPHRCIRYASAAHVAVEASGACPLPRQPASHRSGAPIHPPYGTWFRERWSRRDNDVPRERASPGKSQKSPHARHRAARQSRRGSRNAASRANRASRCARSGLPNDSRQRSRSRRSRAPARGRLQVRGCK